MLWVLGRQKCYSNDILGVKSNLRGQDRDLKTHHLATAGPDRERDCCWASGSGLGKPPAATDGKDLKAEVAYKQELVSGTGGHGVGARAGVGDEDPSSATTGCDRSPGFAALNVTLLTETPRLQV